MVGGGVRAGVPRPVQAAQHLARLIGVGLQRVESVATPVIEVRDIACSGASGSYVHDRRSGRRRSIAEIAEAPLTRHEVDDLYDITLVSALDGRTLVLAGPQSPGTVPGVVYRRLASDAQANGVPVIADITGEPLSEALAGGMTWSSSVRPSSSPSTSRPATTRPPWWSHSNTRAARREQRRHIARPRVLHRAHRRGAGGTRRPPPDRG